MNIYYQAPQQQGDVYRLDLQSRLALVANKNLEWLLSKGLSFKTIDANVIKLRSILIRRTYQSISVLETISKFFKTLTNK